jgi:hypothetical protein
MCGEDSSVRIKRVGNGFTIDAYTPGSKGKPGEHKESVATKPEHVLRAVAAHIGKRKGKAFLSESDAPVKLGKKPRRKRGAMKRV